VQAGGWIDAKARETVSPRPERSSTPRPPAGRMSRPPQHARPHRATDRHEGGGAEGRGLGAIRGMLPAGVAALRQVRRAPRSGRGASSRRGFLGLGRSSVYGLCSRSAPPLPLAPLSGRCRSCVTIGAPSCGCSCASRGSSASASARPRQVLDKFSVFAPPPEHAAESAKGRPFRTSWLRRRPRLPAAEASRQTDGSAAKVAWFLTSPCCGGAVQWKTWHASTSRGAAAAFACPRTWRALDNTDEHARTDHVRAASAA
jgi:hypothetical protein